MLQKYRSIIISVFLCLALISAYYGSHIKFTFSFDQFFPQGDPDLAFYQEFKKNFEADDNFLLIAVNKSPSIFDSSFLKKFHDFSIKSRDLPHVIKAQSLTQIRYPVKTPFGFTSIPILDYDAPEKYMANRFRILNDDRFRNQLINTDGKSIVVVLKTIEDINIDQSSELIDALNQLLSSYDFEETHILGRAYFQKELVDFQKYEMIISFFASIILVFIIMILIYRRPIGVLVSMFSIALGLLLFVGYLGVFGRELTAISALFPVIMLIVGSSDVIHIFSKYTDELSLGRTTFEAMKISIKEIGLATLMTSLTTAMGFLTLMTSRLGTIQDFGIDAAVGVMVAFITVLLFTTSVLTYFTKEQIIKTSTSNNIWSSFLNKVQDTIISKPSKIVTLSSLTCLISLLGMIMISTNYKIEDNLPRRSKVAQDFLFFEKNFGGFRPLEIAITVKPPHQAEDFLVQKEVNSLETYLRSSLAIENIAALPVLYKSLNMAMHNDNPNYLRFPEDSVSYNSMKKYIDKMGTDNLNLFVSEDKMKTRISARIKDIGADSIKHLGAIWDKWITQNINHDIIETKRTGTGIILDKNAEYVTESLLKGLGLSILVISLLMGLLFQSIRMIIIALIPNVLPLLFAAGILGYFEIELEAGIAIIFAVIFGISVDDSIHFLGRYKLSLTKGTDNTSAVLSSLHETGKAIIFTTIILFFGFLNTIFSSNPPTFTVGVLISVTLFSALLYDLYLLPVLLIKFMKGSNTIT